jgi:hypothetical protein
MATFFKPLSDVRVSQEITIQSESPWGGSSISHKNYAEKIFTGKHTNLFCLTVNDVENKILAPEADDIKGFLYSYKIS